MKAVLVLFSLYFYSSVALAPPSLSMQTTRSSLAAPKFQQVLLGRSSSSPPPPIASSMLPLQAASTITHAQPPPIGLKVVSGIKKAASAVKRELSMTLGMLESDIPVTIILGSICTFAFGFARTSALSTSDWVSMALKALAWFFGYGYFFDIGNQMTGIEEDKLNLGEVSCKANRPLATGAMSLEGAKVRHFLSGIYYMAVSWSFGGLKLSLCALLWIVSSQLYNFRGWGNHFVTKNYCTMATGSIAMLLGARAIAGEALTSTVPPILAAVWIGLCMDSQDLRDETGDRLSGRHTTAVLWGLDTARKAYVGLAALSTGSLMYIMRHCLSWPDAVIAVGIVAHLVRTLQNKTAKEDHKTYKEICLAGAAFFCRSAFWAHLF